MPPTTVEVRFMVAAIGDTKAIRFNAVSDNRRGMVHGLSVDGEPVKTMSSLAQIPIGDASRELIELYREIMMLHLTGQNVPQRNMGFVGTVYSEVISRNKQRREKWEALNVIPMRMGEQNRGVDRRGSVRQQLSAE